jgi:hypothetical protein
MLIFFLPWLGQAYSLGDLGWVTLTVLISLRAGFHLGQMALLLYALLSLDTARFKKCKQLFEYQHFLLETCGGQF